MNTLLFSSSSRILPSKAHTAGRRRQWGAEVVEIALTMVYFLLIIFSFMEGVRLISNLTILDYLARDAVRYAVVRGHRAASDATTNGAPATKASMTTYIQNQENLLILNPGSITVEACWWANGTCEDAGVVHNDTDPANIIYNNSAGQPFSVTVSHSVFNIFSGLLWLNPTGTYTRRAEGRILY